LILRGFSLEKFESERSAIDGVEAARHFVSCRPYTDDEEEIADDICAASVVIMPSMQEGYGLVALEAIAAGIPIVISAESGIAEFLLSKVVPSIDAIVQKCVVDVIGEDEKVAEAWAGRIAEIFLDQESAFTEAATLRSALQPVLTWERAARRLSTEIEGLLAKASQQPSTVSNHELSMVASSFATLASQAPQHEGKEPLVTQ
jgi:glycosyltransferase involved in cell wall biosynthesis